MRYLLTIHQPDAPPPDVDLEAVMARVGEFIAETRAANSWVFNGGLHPPSTATVVRVRDDELLLTDGPYTEGKEHIGGLVVVEEADLDAALGWAKQLARILGLPIEVRPFADG